MTRTVTLLLCPYCDGDKVYLHFGPYGTVCITSSEKLFGLPGSKYSPQHGPGGSPVLYEDLLIISCDGQDIQYVVALDKRTGKIRRKTSRAAHPPDLFTAVRLVHDGTVRAWTDDLGAPGGLDHQWRGVSLVPAPMVSIAQIAQRPPSHG